MTLPVTCSSREIVAADERCSRGVSVGIKNVSIAFDGRTVLENFDIEISAGEFVAIVGRSGCGKSTLLRSVAGLERPQTGTIILGKVAEHNEKPDVRVMFQDSRLLPWRRILPNVMLGLEPVLIPRARKVLAQVGLAERASDWPATLSGGQRQRVALARALVHDPNLLLLDEPLGSLDALTRIEMQQLIEDVWRTRGFTAMLVTHDVAEAISLADRVILIEGGRVALDEVVNIPRPRTRGSARFAALEERILGRVLQRRAGCRRSVVKDSGERMDLMAKDTAAPIILEDKPRICECPVHPLLAGRRSSHAFASTSVEPETLASLMEAARWAPSSMNEQPWSFIIATKANKSDFGRLLGCLVEFNVQWAQHAPLLLLSVAKLTFESTGEVNRHAFHDVGQAIANLTFQATVSGMVVHQIAGFDIEKARREFSIPEDYEPVAAAAIGYPGNSAELPEKLRKRDANPRQRKPLTNFVFEGGWGHSADWTRGA
jgi:sulfonate transport system ATP-binding protein